MTTSINALQLRAVMGKRDWQPPEPFGPDGWRMAAAELHPIGIPVSSVIVTCSPMPGHDGDIVHASIAHLQHMPTYDELVLLHRAVWGRTGWACQLFVPSPEHVNIHPFALHLWGRRDGRPMLEFGVGATI